MSRCRSTLSGVQCTKDLGHFGYHINGSLCEWLDDTPPAAETPCGAVVAFLLPGDTAHTCTRPGGHQGAHGDGLVLWTDPCPIPQFTDMTDYEGWDWLHDAFDAVTITHQQEDQ